jgi:uncharacterized membrane protein YgcG/tetratricopeptide (TPR) repeat protein
MRSRRICVPLSLSLALAATLTANLGGAEPGREAAALNTPPLKTPRIDQFDKYFALSIKPDAKALPHKAEAHDIVVLFDTSASQNGEFRDRALAALDQFLANLGRKDQVQLLAVDIDATPLTTTFVAPQGEDMRRALEALRKRVPLGTTDMPAAMKAAAAAYTDQGNPARPRAAVYIGDGMSLGGMISADEMKELTELLVSKRIPVSSFGVGPRIDTVLLAALANHTGGVVGIDVPDDKDNPKQLEPGRILAAVATEVVLWPGQLVLPESFKEVYPKRTPPLRADRDTILIGVGRASAPFTAKVSATIVSANAAGRPENLTWSIFPTPASDDHAYLAPLVELAQQDDGVLLATLGTEGLKEARRAAADKAMALHRVARQVAKAQPAAARVIDQQARRLDPSLPGGLHFVQAPEDAKAPGDGIVVELPPGEKRPPAVPGQLLNEAVRQQNLEAQKLEQEVRIRLEQARREMSSDAERAMAGLKLLQEQVRRDINLTADRKADLLQQIEAVMQQVARTQLVNEKQRLAEQAAAAVRAENIRLQHELSDREKQLSQWMAKFDALMDEKKYTQAESIADLAVSVAPTNPEIANAAMNATMQRAIADGVFLREQRIRGALATLREVEYSHIPTPDEPPVIFPPKEWWETMSRRREKYKAVSLASESPAEQKIMDELQKPTTFEFSETPLKDVIVFLGDLHKINIEFDRKALDDVQINPDETLITRNLKDVTLKAALKLVLEQLNLAYVIKNEVLLITTKEQADAYLITKVYPVADLVIPVEAPLMGGGGLGSGGGGGQFGGGGQGGGQFGGGGGQGGGGQGGGGFGGFNPTRIPIKLQSPEHDARPQMPAAPRARSTFRAFQTTRVPIKLESPKRDARPQAPAAPRPAAAARPIQVQAANGEDLDAVWNRHFAGNKDISQEAIRATLRSLREAKKYDEVVTVLQAALRNGQAQPWMYEAMALAMFAAGKPAEEIERTLMSAADFANNSTDLVYLAQYLYRNTPNYFAAEARTRFLRRALRIFQQVVKMDPSSVDAYVHGLTVAKRLDDLSGIQWATLGLVSQAWGPEDREVVRSAQNTARATIQQLLLEKRTKEAQAFENALAEALRRDVMVVVSWTGDADVDLLVEEPGGTVCSGNNPRTTSGGMHVGGSWELGENIQGRQIEAYVCPHGFSGEYRAIIRRAFGRPTTGKVKVEIKRHFKTKRSNVLEPGTETAVVWEALGDEDVVLPFTLEGGRRTEPLKDQQLRQSLVRAGEARDQMLRELWQSTDAATYSSAQEAVKRRAVEMQRRRPPRGGGPVGFQPVIATFPEGSQMLARAVISGDRRFVRVTPTPFFSFISEVNVFNFATGQGSTNNSQGQGGGGGFSGGSGGGFGGGGGGGAF